MEDMQSIDGILGQLQDNCPDFIPLLKRKREIRILNVGSGNWKKLLYFARKLRGMGVNAVVDFIEPKLEQRRKLLQIFEADCSGHFRRIYPKTIEDAESSHEYEIITALHTLYESPRNKDGTISTLKKTIGFLAESGLCIFAVEDSRGDFQKMKKTFYPSFGKTEPVSVEVVEKSLRKEGIAYTVGAPIEFNFSLDMLKDADEEELGGHMSFLFSDSLDCPPLSPQQRKLVGKWVRKNARKKGNNEYLWAPEIIIWARKRAHK